jgi:quercetin dioxygenase-like cupin family protein
MPVIDASALQGRDMEGAHYGATISLIISEGEPGEGPRLHRHPYDETWIVEEGTLTFQLGDALHEVSPGDIVIAPARVPHKFVNDGPGRSKVACVHASPRFVTEWLE